MNRNRARLGIAFAAVGGLGIVLGFMLSARLDLTDGALAAPTAGAPDPGVPPGTAPSSIWSSR